MSRAFVRNAPSANEDLQCQIAGLLANLSEETENQISLLNGGCVPVLATLARVKTTRSSRTRGGPWRTFGNKKTTSRPIGRASTLCASVRLGGGRVQRYAAMGLRFLSSHPRSGSTS